jgi:hypothetical protein
MERKNRGILCEKRGVHHPDTQIFLINHLIFADQQQYRIHEEHQYISGGDNPVASLLGDSAGRDGGHRSASCDGGYVHTVG